MHDLTQPRLRLLRLISFSYIKRVRVSAMALITSPIDVLRLGAQRVIFSHSSQLLTFRSWEELTVLDRQAAD